MATTKLMDISPGMLSNKAYMADYVAALRQGHVDSYTLMKMLRLTSKPGPNMLWLADKIVEALNLSVERIVLEYVEAYGDQPAVFTSAGITPFRRVMKTTVSGFPSLFKEWSAPLARNMDALGIYTNGGLTLLTTHCVLCASAYGTWIGPGCDLNTKGLAFYNTGSVPQVLFDGPLVIDHPESSVVETEMIRGVCVCCTHRCTQCGWTFSSRPDREAIRTMAMSRVCVNCSKEFLIHIAPPRVRMEDRRRVHNILTKMGG